MSDQTSAPRDFWHGIHIPPTWRDDTVLNLVCRGADSTFEVAAFTVGALRAVLAAAPHEPEPPRPRDMDDAGFLMYAGSQRAGEIIAALQSVGADKMGHGNTVIGMVEALVERFVAASRDEESPRTQASLDVLLDPFRVATVTRDWETAGAAYIALLKAWLVPPHEFLTQEHYDALVRDAMRWRHQSTAESPRQTWWLIEYAQHDSEPASWWTGLWFSSDAQTAARFVGRDEAETAMRRLEINERMDRSHLIVTEHVWLAGRDEERV